MIPKKLKQMPTSMAAKEKELRRVETGLFFLILFLLFIAGGADCAAAPSFFTFWCVSFFLYYMRRFLSFSYRVDFFSSIVYSGVIQTIFFNLIRMCYLVIISTDQGTRMRHVQIL